MAKASSQIEKVHETSQKFPNRVVEWINIVRIRAKGYINK